MSSQAEKIQGFLTKVSNSRGGVLPPDEADAIADWYQTILNSIHAINLVIQGDADLAWDHDTNEPIFALTDAGFEKADPELREKAISKNAIN